MSFAKTPVPAHIHDLQTMLRTVLPEQGLGRDGIYGNETHEAVKNYQASQGLPQNGVTDQATWDALVKDYEHALVLQAEAAPLQIILQPYQVLERGSKNLHIYLVQGMLMALSRLYYDMPELLVTGTLDEPTANALLWLQKAGEMPETGTLDKHTWRHLAAQYRLMVGDGTGSFPVRRTQRTTAERR